MEKFWTPTLVAPLAVAITLVTAVTVVRRLDRMVNPHPLVGMMKNSPVTKLDRLLLLLVLVTGGEPTWPPFGWVTIVCWIVTSPCEPGWLVTGTPKFVYTKFVITF